MGFNSAFKWLKLKTVLKSESKLSLLTSWRYKSSSGIVTHSFLNSAFEVNYCSNSRCGTHQTGGWEGPTIDLDDLEKIILPCRH